MITTLSRGLSRTHQARYIAVPPLLVLFLAGLLKPAGGVSRTVLSPATPPTPPTTDATVSPAPCPKAAPRLLPAFFFGGLAKAGTSAPWPPGPEFASAAEPGNGGANWGWPPAAFSRSNFGAKAFAAGARFFAGEAARTLFLLPVMPGSSEEEDAVEGTVVGAGSLDVAGTAVLFLLVVAGVDVRSADPGGTIDASIVGRGSAATSVGLLIKRSFAGVAIRERLGLLGGADAGWHSSFAGSTAAARIGLGCSMPESVMAFIVGASASTVAVAALFAASSAFGFCFGLLGVSAGRGSDVSVASASDNDTADT